MTYFLKSRSYECFKYLHQGIISPIKRKSLPEIAKVVGISSPQSLLDAVALCWKPTRPRCIATSFSSEFPLVSRRAKKDQITYWEITTDPETMPENSTSFVMTNIQATRSQLKKTLGNLYGLRTWVEYGFRQCKQELGWTDYRFTNFSEIHKWWEMIFCAYLMISLNTQAFISLNSECVPLSNVSKINTDLTFHPQWNFQTGWKNVLNNVRLLIQPSFLLWLIFPWLEVFPNPYLLLGLHNLIDSINQFPLLPLSG
jgi:hypothetical protein